MIAIYQSIVAYTLRNIILIFFAIHTKDVHRGGKGGAGGFFKKMSSVEIVNEQSPKFPSYS